MMKALRTEAEMCLEGADLVVMGQRPHFFHSIPEERQKTRGERSYKRQRRVPPMAFLLFVGYLAITQYCYFHCHFLKWWHSHVCLFT